MAVLTVTVDSATGVDTRNMFMGTIPYFINHSGAGGGTSGSVVFSPSVNGAQSTIIYKNAVTGTGIDTATPYDLDVSGTIATETLSGSVDNGSTYSNLAHFSYSGTYPLNSLAGLTPDVLTNQYGYKFTLAFVGAAGADTLVGSNSNDTFTGGGGNDTIIGNGGVDTAVYSGSRANYAIAHNIDGSLVITDKRPGSPDGTDTLSGIEQLRFSDTLVSTKPVNDYTGDATGDILLRDTASGAVSFWTLSNAAFVQSTSLGGIGGNIQIAGNGDFNGDGTSDILLHDNTSGSVTIWTMSHGHFDSSTTVGGFGSSTQIIGTGDFNGDGTSDILLRDVNGAISFWAINEGHFVSSTQIGGVGSNIQIAGTGDFNGDGTTDVLLRDTSSGAVTDWAINNGVLTGSHQIGGIGASIQIAGVGDFNGDGTSDILLRDTNSGSVSYWQVNNNAMTLSQQIGGIASTTQVAGVRDINGDGFSDVLLRDASGGIGAFTVNAGLFQSFVSLGNVGSSIQIAG